MLPFISADASGPKHLNTVLTRQKYEELTDELLEKTIEPCQQCLADAQMKPEQIDEVLLVGGQTRAPKVAEVVRRVFGKEPNRAVNPDEGVAMGAAIQTGIIQGEVKDLVLLDVTPHTLGHRDQGRHLHAADRAQQHDPDPQEPRVHDRRRQPDAGRGARAAGRERHGGLQQEPAEVRAHQHPAGAARACRRSRSASRSTSTASCRSRRTDQATGRRQAITIHPSGGLSQADVNRLVDETRKRETEDKSKKEQEGVVRQLDGLVANTMRSVQALEGKLTPDEQQRILDSIERAKKARNGGPLEELKAALSDMEKAAGIIGQAMLRP